MSDVTSVILCGGAGARLWPVSRERFPKQFLALLGEHTLLQQTLLRAAHVSGARPPVIVCNYEQSFIVAEQVRRLGIPARILLEPERRDSGPAIAAAAEIIAREDPGSLMLVLPSDHQVDDFAGFAEAVAEGSRTAAQGHIVTFGITPTRPATEFGYISPGAVVHGHASRLVQAFVEKPDTDRAGQYIGQGFLWNSGMFLFRPADLLEDLASFEPAMMSAVQTAVDEISRDGNQFERLGRAGFLASPSKSIDYAVMERTSRAAVLPVSFSWSDVGSWKALWELERLDTAGNAQIGPVELMDTRGSYVRSDGPLTAVVGLDEVIVVATADAVLVAAKEEAQRVKELVATLTRGLHRSVAVTHPTVFRPWGSIRRVYETAPGVSVHHVTIEHGAAVRLEYPLGTTASLTVTRGKLTAAGRSATALVEMESLAIAGGDPHRLVNIGPDPVELIEVRAGKIGADLNAAWMDDEPRPEAVAAE